MYESDTESPVARRKRLEVDSQHPSVLNEYIKCVVVGDSGVGEESINEPRREKTNNVVSKQVQLKPSCAITEDS